MENLVKEGQRSEELRAFYQSQWDRAMQKLPTLDFANLVSIIDWLGDIRDASDRGDVVKDPMLIVGAFRRHGYVANAGLDGNYNKEDEESVARFIIGQALDGLENDGAIHPLFHLNTRIWRLKFGH